MDERELIRSAITNINSAKSILENFPKSGMSQKSLREMDLAYSSLNDSINHFNGIYGPAATPSNR